MESFCVSIQWAVHGHAILLIGYSVIVKTPFWLGVHVGSNFDQARPRAVCTPQLRLLESRLHDAANYVCVAFSFIVRLRRCYSVARFFCVHSY